jgi:hypothetical protein
MSSQVGIIEIGARDGTATYEASGKTYERNLGLQRRADEEVYGVFSEDCTIGKEVQGLDFSGF